MKFSRGIQIGFIAVVIIALVSSRTLFNSGFTRTVRSYPHKIEFFISEATVNAGNFSVIIDGAETRYGRIQVPVSFKIDRSIRTAKPLEVSCLFIPESQGTFTLTITDNGVPVGVKAFSGSEPGTLSASIRR